MASVAAALGLEKYTVLRQTLPYLGPCLERGVHTAKGLARMGSSKAACTALARDGCVRDPGRPKMTMPAATDPKLPELFLHYARVLKQMDDEATSRWQYKDGHWYPSGLRQYHGHYNAIYGTKVSCEKAWPRRMAVLLNESGVPTDFEVPYPTSALLDKTRQSCDLRHCAGSRTHWTELKGSWPVWFDAQGREKLWHRFRSYLMEETLQDFMRLERLIPNHATDISVVLIGFDSPKQRLDGAVEELSERVAPGWDRFFMTGWKEPHYSTDVKIWIWHKKK